MGSSKFSCPWAWTSSFCICVCLTALWYSQRTNNITLRLVVMQENKQHDGTWFKANRMELMDPWRDPSWTIGKEVLLTKFHSFWFKWFWFYKTYSNPSNISVSDILARAMDLENKKTSYLENYRRYPFGSYTHIRLLFLPFQ